MGKEVSLEFFIFQNYMNIIAINYFFPLTKKALGGKKIGRS